ncbi:MAG: InlB B-repeat-containing protein, partial [Clostridia bacterium]|nr:InlB B-repeat-containing protein [Clostridia bacterium]
METMKGNHKNRYHGISLLVLIITIIVMIIISGAVILIVMNQGTINTAKETALRTDMRTMVDNYDQRYKEVLYDYQGDDSKLKNSDFNGVVPDKYFDTGDYVAEKDGVRYQGDDEKTKVIAKEMGLLVGKQTNLTGIESITLSNITTNSVKAEVNLTGNPTGNFNYTYYIYDGTRWIISADMIADGIYNYKSLKQNFGYKVRVDVSDAYENSFTSDEVAFSTQDLMLGRVILRLNDKNGSDYVPNTWTNQSVYVESVQTEQDTRTSYTVSGTNVISSDTEVGSVLALQGKSTVTYKTTDGNNEKSAEHIVLIDKEAPTATYDITKSTKDITVKVLNANDNLSGVKEFRYYLDGIIKSTQKEPTYVFSSGIAQNTKYKIKVVIVDVAGNEKVYEQDVTTDTVPSAETITIEANPTTWTNQDVNIKVKYTGVSNMRVQYSKDGNNWTLIGNVGVTGEYNTTVSSNTTVYVRYIDGIGQAGLSKTLTIGNIDKTPPTLPTLTNDSNGEWVNRNVTITATSTDNASGIKSITYSYDQKNWLTDVSLEPISSGSKTYKMTGVWSAPRENLVYIKAEDNAGNVSEFATTYVRIDKTLPTIDEAYAGSFLYGDPTFKSGTNGMNVYNNSSNGTVTLERIASTSDNPTGSSHMMQIRTAGTASPGLGGFYTYTNSKSGGVFVHKIIAKIPVGYTMEPQSNSCGDGYYRTWLTPKDGTGKFEEYIYVTKCGTTGTFSSFGHVNISGPAASAQYPVTWYVAYNNMMDTTAYGVTNAIMFKGSDNVGVNGYGMNQSSTTAPTFTNMTASKTMGKSFENITTNGTYYVWLRDTVGNVNKKEVAVNYVRVDVTATFDAQGGTVSPTSKVVSINGTYGTLPTPTRTGYTFNGWYTGTNGTGTNITASTTVTNTSNHTLYAKWTINNYTATFNANGGSTASPSTITKSYGSQLGTLPTTSKTGYTFKGWYTATSGGTQISTTTTMPASNVTYYAQWTVNTYILDLNPYMNGTNGGGGSRITVGLKVNGVDQGYITDYYKYVAYGTSWQVYGVRMDGFTLAYNISGTVAATTNNVNINFYELTIGRNNTSYGTVSSSSLIALTGQTYSTSGATLTMSDGRKVTASATAATGYSTSFSSWSVGSATMNTARTVNANFTRTGYTYYVSYNGNGNTGGSTARSTHIYGTAKALTGNGFERGYASSYGGGQVLWWSFNGWNTNSSGTGTSYSNGQSVLNLTSTSGGTVNLYAKWVCNKTGIVTATGNSLNIRTGPGGGYANIGEGIDGYNRYVKTNGTAKITNSAYVNYGSSGILWFYINVPVVKYVGYDLDDGNRS